MAFAFKPAIERGDTLYELPRPVVSVRIQDAWDFEQLKVPLKGGDFLAGHSRQGVDIAIEGRVGSHQGDLLISEEQMLDAIAALRAALDVTSDGEKYAFYLYHDAATETYRKFQSCSTVRFDYDLSNPRLFEYSALIHAEDPTIYTTGPET